MDSTGKDIERAVVRLVSELDECHRAAMRMFNYGASYSSHDARMNSLKVAARLMQAGASTALSLQRLNRQGGTQTMNDHPEERPPTPQKSKTNVPQGPNGQARHAQTVHRA